MADRDAIVERLYEYALAIDTRDWALYRGVFSDRVWIDFSRYSGVPGQEMAADTWVAGTADIVAALDATQHVMSNPLVTVAGDRARCRMYIQAMHFLWSAPGTPEFVLGGYYDDELVSEAGAWRIASVTFHVFWRRGNEGVMTLARQRSETVGDESA